MHDGVFLQLQGTRSAAQGVNHQRQPCGVMALQELHDQPAVPSLSATISQYFIGGMMPESANPAQQSRTVIEIRPFKVGWQCYEGPGVQPYWTGDTAKEDAIGYAIARAKFGRGEIRVLDNAGEVERVISFDQTGK
jgi:hypothetical protein